MMVRFLVISTIVLLPLVASSATRLAHAADKDNLTVVDDKSLTREEMIKLMQDRQKKTKQEEQAGKNGKAEDVSKDSGPVVPGEKTEGSDPSTPPLSAGETGSL